MASHPRKTMDKKNSRKEVIAVKGMHCKKCSEKIVSRVGALDGVKEISVDLLKDRVHVEYNPDETNLDEIKKEISSLGYNAGDGKGTIVRGLVYGLAPHIGCIAFIVGSVLGATVLMEAFKPLLMNPYFFHILVAISVGFATLSSVVYLKKNSFLSMAGVKRKKVYLSTMYGSTVGINLLLFFVIFPLIANVSNAPLTGAAVDMPGIATVSMSVEIPCPGHAPLISEELKTIDGVLSVQFSYPNIFDVQYDSSKTSVEEMKSLEVFEIYKATILEQAQTTQQNQDTGGNIAAVPSLSKASAAVGSCGGSCGGCGCGCGG